MSQTDALENLKVNPDNLYREETVTDLQSASIRILIPVTVDGKDDPSRERLFEGQTYIISPTTGLRQISAEIDAKNLSEALTKFPAAITRRIKEMQEEEREYQRQMNSRIVVPNGGVAPPVAGGRIQL